jgi:hypothetical protein
VYLHGCGRTAMCGDGRYARLFMRYAQRCRDCGRLARGRSKKRRICCGVESGSGTEGELRPLGSYGRNRSDFCHGSRVGSTRSIDPELPSSPEELDPGGSYQVNTNARCSNVRRQSNSLRAVDPEKLKGGQPTCFSGSSGVDSFVRWSQRDSLRCCFGGERNLESRPAIRLGCRR